MSQRKPLTVSINWSTMFYACMDVYCTCGDQFHVDVWDKDKKSPEFVRCPHCEAVYRCGNEVPLVIGKLDYRRLDGTAHAFVQWKGTELHGTAHCNCGNDDAINRDFAYEHKCTVCGTNYNVDSHIDLHRLSDEEIAALPEGAIIVALDEDEQFEVDPESVPPKFDPTALSTFRRKSGPITMEVLPDVHIGMPPEQLDGIWARLREALGGNYVLSGDFLELGFHERCGSMQSEAQPGAADFRLPTLRCTSFDPSSASIDLDALGLEPRAGRFVIIITDGDPLPEPKSEPEKE